MATQRYDDELRGVLFKNENRTTDQYPHYSGHVQVDGSKYRLSAWIKEAKSGTKYMSLALTPKDDER